MSSQNHVKEAMDTLLKMFNEDNFENVNSGLIFLIFSGIKIPT